MTKFIPSESLQKCYEDYYILLEDSLLGKKFDIIKCIQPMLSWTTIVKANGEVHSFAANMKYGIEKGWFIPFSHSAYARLYVKDALETAAENALIDADPDEGPGVSKKEFYVGPNNGVSVNYTFSVQKKSILNAYPENLIQ